MKKDKLNKSGINTSRRNFLRMNWHKEEVPKNDDNTEPAKTQKMLMPDGTLVEVELTEEILNANKNKATNREILQWMKKTQFENNKQS